MGWPHERSLKLFQQEVPGSMCVAGVLGVRVLFGVGCRLRDLSGCNV